MRTLKLEYEDAKELITCHYSGNGDFGKMMKYNFPKSLRVWDGQQKRWAVSKKGLTPLLRWARLYADVLDTDALPPSLQKRCEGWEGAAMPVDSSDADCPHAVLHLLPSAPSSVVRAAFLALSKQLHPDKGGDPEEFLKIKEAYEKLCQEG